ncbi:unnamed protein product [Victoria cruziana]
MHGGRSLEPELIPLVPNVNRLCRELRARSTSDMGQQILAGGQMPPLKSRRDCSESSSFRRSTIEEQEGWDPRLELPTMRSRHLRSTCFHPFIV